MAVSCDDILNVLVGFIPSEFHADNRIESIIRGAIFLIAIIISSFHWKVTVQDREFKFRNSIGRKKLYSFYQVSKVDVMVKTYHLSYDTGFKIRKIMKIRRNDKNAIEFLLRLFDHGVPFYQRGMMVKREDTFT